MNMNNSIVTSNSAVPTGGGILVWDGPTTVAYSVLWHNSDPGLLVPDNKSACAHRRHHGVGKSVPRARPLMRPRWAAAVAASLPCGSRLSVAIREAQRETAQAEVERSDDVAGHFEDVVAVLTKLDIDRTWAAATELERRVLLDEFLGEVTVLPGYLNVTIHGASPVHVLYQEVGLKESEFDLVGGPDYAKSDWRIRPWDQQR